MSQTSPSGPLAASAMRAPPGVLDGPIAPTLLRLALPTIVVLVVQTLVGILETYFVGFLGTAALAGTALVFPVLMLMQMMSNGGIGGGVASAVARAIGAGRRADAEALAWHAVVLAIALGAVFSLAAISGGPWLYHAMGGESDTLAAALTYSNAVFAGSIPLWIVALLSAVLRGAGNVRMPAVVTLAGAILLVPLSPALIFGFGPIPRFGVAGGGVAVVIYYLIAMAMLIGFMRSPQSPIRLTIAPLSGRLFRDILGVGLLSAIGTVQANLTVALITAAVGQFGANAIAGYGLASRLDYLQIPLLFGLGTGLVTMAGINTGAGQTARATRVAWTGAAIAFAVTETIGLAAALFPTAWLGLFTDAPPVLASGTLYLHTVAPFYGVAGAGMALYFAGQGARRVLAPLLAGTARLIVAAGVGWLAVATWGAGLSTLFVIVAISSVLFGGIIVAATIARARSETGAAPAIQASAAE
ncbi:MATE family efflux transporter [Bradyrhizobium erythrophlei]|uniref:MATE family efflux transporter n=1 Tax=Bradyrhizobium erythrophlei TaxID=1437360 RepID=UPI0035EECC35